LTLEEKQIVKAVADKLCKQFKTDTLTAEQFATYLGMTPVSVRNSIRVRKLPGAKVGGKFIIPVDSVALWEARISKTKEESGF